MTEKTTRRPNPLNQIGVAPQSRMGETTAGRVRRPLSLKPEDPLIATYMEIRADLERYFRVRLRSEDAAQDLVQDIYLRITDAPDRHVANPVAYLYRIGANLMLDGMKQGRRSQRRETQWRESQVEEAGGESVAPEPAADDVVAARQRLARILDAVRQMPPVIQEAFRLHKLEGRSHSETAQAMGISRSSVEKHMMTCLRLLSKRVDR